VGGKSEGKYLTESSTITHYCDWVPNNWGLTYNSYSLYYNCQIPSTVEIPSRGSYGTIPDVQWCQLHDRFCHKQLKLANVEMQSKSMPCKTSLCMQNLIFQEMVSMSTSQ